MPPPLTLAKLPETVLLVIVTVWPEKMPPPVPTAASGSPKPYARLPVRVLSVTVIIPGPIALEMPAPLEATLPERVLLVTVNAANAELKMPPPATAELPERVLLVTVNTADLELKMPPPPWALKLLESV